MGGEPSQTIASAATDISRPESSDARVPSTQRLDYVSPIVAKSGPATGPTLASSGTFDWNSPDESVLWNREHHVREYSIERDAILFHPELQLLCQLNETAYFIWRCCARRSIIELGEFLQNAYAVEASTARQHVLRIIEVFAVNYFVSQESPDAVAC